MRVQSMQSRARKSRSSWLSYLTRPQQGVNGSDGVPNVAAEEPGVCFGKIHARTAEARSEGEKIIRVLSASSGVFTKSKTNVEKG